MERIRIRMMHQSIRGYNMAYRATGNKIYRVTCIRLINELRHKIQASEEITRTMERLR